MSDDDFLAPPVLRMGRIPAGVFCEPNVVLNGVDLFSTVHVGLFSYMNTGMLRSGVYIGRYCSIGRRVTVGAARHPVDWLTSHPFVRDARYRPPGLDFPSHPTTVGNDVWIGDNALVMEGLTIGDGAVIGASAVVTHDVPPYAVVAGVPARILRYRFAEAARARLLALRWWQYHPRHLVGVPADRLEDALAFFADAAARFSVLPPCFAEVA